MGQRSSPPLGTLSSSSSSSSSWSTRKSAADARLRSGMLGQRPVSMLVAGLMIACIGGSSSNYGVAAMRPVQTLYSDSSCENEWKIVVEPAEVDTCYEHADDEYIEYFCDEDAEKWGFTTYNSSTCTHATFNETFFGDEYFECHYNEDDGAWAIEVCDDVEADDWNVQVVQYSSTNCSDYVEGFTYFNLEDCVEVSNQTYLSMEFSYNTTHVLEYRYHTSTECEGTPTTIASAYKLGCSDSVYAEILSLPSDDDDDDDDDATQGDDNGSILADDDTDDAESGKISSALLAVIAIFGFGILGWSLYMSFSPRSSYTALQQAPALTEIDA